MADAAPKLLTIDEWLAWSAANPDAKTELIDGVIVPKDAANVFGMAPEHRPHGRIKSNIGREIGRAIDAAALPCTVYIDSIGVPLADQTCVIPDVLVECGPEIDEGRLSESPTVVVEVLSPSNTMREMTRKLLGYFRLPSVAHYLVVDPVAHSIDHHFRNERGEIEIVAVESGTLVLEPPGLVLEVARIFARRG